MNYKIIAISTSTKIGAIACVATVTPEAIHFADLKPIGGTVAEIHKSLSAYQALSKKINAELIIEDNSSLFLAYGRNVHLSDKAVSGKPVVVEAFDKYQSLSKLSGLTYPQNLQTQFQISQSIYEVKHHDNGSVSYLVDWSRLSDAARLQLLVIYVGVCRNVYDSGYFLSLVAGGSNGDTSWHKNLEVTNRRLGGRKIKL